MEYIPYVEYNSAMQKHKLLIHMTTRKDLKILMLNKRSQTKREYIA
jgi:hypothetical protein